MKNAYLQEDVTPWIQYFYPSECGHQGQTDRPELFNKVFEEFFTDGMVSRETANMAGISERKSEIKSLISEATTHDK